MKQDKNTDIRTPSLWRDPRLYQIVSLSALLVYGLLFLHFDISFRQILVTLGAAQLTQYAATRFSKLPTFDPKSALISSLSLCLLLRTDSLAVAAEPVNIAIESRRPLPLTKSIHLTPDFSSEANSLGPLREGGRRDEEASFWHGPGS